MPMTTTIFFELRKKLNVSQEEVARRIGVSTNTIRNWERGDGKPTGDKIAKCCQVYQVTPEKLVAAIAA